MAANILFKVFFSKILFLSAQAIFLAFLSGCIHHKKIESPSPENTQLRVLQHHLDSTISEVVSQHKLSGLNISLAIDSQIIYQKSFGYADLKNKTPLNNSSQFRAASLGKIINAIAILRLHENGIIDIDSPINEYVPEFRNQFSNTRKITFRHILSHQSGLPSDRIHGMWDDEVEDFRETIEYLNTTHFPDQKKDQYLYSNLAHNLLAVAIENLTNEHYTVYMNSLLKQLGMHNSYFSNDIKNHNLALSYFKKNKKARLKIRDIPAAGFISTSEDLVTLAMALNNRSKDVFENMETFAKLTNNQKLGAEYPVPYDIGLGVFGFNGIFHHHIPVYGHSAASLHQRSVLKFSPDTKLAVVVLSNDSNSSKIIHKISNASLREAYKFRYKQPFPSPHVYWPPPQKNDLIDKRDLEGYYASTLGHVEIFQKNKKLRARLFGRTFQLKQREDNGLYYLEYKFLGIVPINIGVMGNLGFSKRVINGSNYLVSTNTLGKSSAIAQQVHPVEIPEAWRNRIGRYESEIPLAAVDLSNGGIKEKSGFLIAFGRIDNKHNLEVVIEPVNDKEAIVKGVGRGFNERVYVEEENGREILRYSGIGFVKLQ